MLSLIKQSTGGKTLGLSQTAIKVMLLGVNKFNIDHPGPHKPRHAFNVQLNQAGKD